MRDLESVGDGAWYTPENIAAGKRLEMTQEIFEALDDIRTARGRKIENEAARDIIAILFHQMAVDELADQLAGWGKARGMVMMEKDDYQRHKKAVELIKQIPTDSLMEWLKDEILTLRAALEKALEK